jgi:hypothetical protein
MVTQKAATNAMELYEVKANNHTFLFECNRPLLAAQGILHLPWQWNLIKGHTGSKYYLEEIKNELEKALRKYYHKV